MGILSAISHVEGGCAVMKLIKRIDCTVRALLRAIDAAIAVVKVVGRPVRGASGIHRGRCGGRLPEARAVDQARLPLGARHLGALERDALEADRQGRELMRTLDASIDIAASPERVWQVISDLPAYVRWNPFIVRAGGELAVGGRLRVTIVAPGHRPVTFKPRILELEPGRSVTWLGRTLLPGLFDGHHTLSVTAHRRWRALSHR